MSESGLIEFHNLRGWAVEKLENQQFRAVCTCGWSFESESELRVTNQHAAHAWVAEPYMTA